MKGKKAPLAERLFEKIDRGEDSECWPWRGKTRKDGYGVIVKGNMDRSEVRAHRVAYELAHGPIPEAFTVDHLCRNRTCCNPAHLEAVPRGENVLRGIGPAAVNRRKKICKRGHPLTPENVFFTSAGYRNCRTCCRIRMRIYRERAEQGLPLRGASALF